MKQLALLAVILDVIGLGVVLSFTLGQPANRDDARALGRDIEHGMRGSYDVAKDAIK